MWSRKTDVIGSCDLCSQAVTATNTQFKLIKEQVMSFSKSLEYGGHALVWSGDWTPEGVRQRFLHFWAIRITHLAIHGFEGNELYDATPSL
jgi:hypothetical protein